MFRFLSRSCVRAGFSITDHSIYYYSFARYSVPVPWRSVLRSNTLSLGHVCAVRQIEQRRRFAESAQKTSSRRLRHRSDVNASTTHITETEVDTEISEPHRAFGEYSSEYMSRMRYKKSSPQYTDLQYNEIDKEEQRPKFKSRTGRRNTSYWYFLQCKALIKQDQLPQALDMFETEMLKGERLEPMEYNYTVLMGGCGRVGYIKKAFKLYNDMKKRGLEPTDATYTALFNACAESPWKQPALEQALKLEQELRRKNIPLNSITYHALLKTVALTADLPSTFRVFRDMLKSGHHVSEEMFHYLLMSCVQDKTNGFRLALQVWHQMLNLGIKPVIQNYNILLRAARDCGIGDVTLASRLLFKTKDDSPVTLEAGRRDRRAKFTEKSRPKVLDLDAFENQLFVDTDSQQSHKDSIKLTEELRTEGMDSHTQHTEPQNTERTPESQFALQVHNSSMPICSPSSSASPMVPPNLLDPVTGRSDVVSLGTVNTASDRLALMGNMEGFLGKMSEHGLQPTLKTLTQLADVMEPGIQTVHSLLSVASEKKLRLDVPFFNTLIRRAANAGNLQEAKTILEMMSVRKLSPDVQSFCNVALACNTKHEGIQLISEMESCRIAPNKHVYSALIRQATRRLDYVYLQEILASMHEKQVAPNEVIIRQLEFAAQYPPTFDKYKSKNTYMEKIDGFRAYYKMWLQIMPGQETPHPWEKFRIKKTAIEEDTDKMNVHNENA